MALTREWRAARAYGEMGIPVFPLSARAKVPLKDSHGELDGTTDPGSIDAMWRPRPDSAPAAALRFTDYFVIDEDAKAFGDEWMGALEAEHGALPDTVTALSGSGYPGMHRWFRRAKELEGIKLAKLAPGVDVKGLQCGYVALPPAKHKSGRTYMWEASSRIDEIEVAETPAWLVSLIRKKASTFSERHQHTQSVDPESFLLGRLFKKAGLLLGEVKPGVFAVECPNEAFHSAGSSKSATVLFAPKEPGGRGTFFCAHTSACAEVLR